MIHHDDPLSMPMRLDTFYRHDLHSLTLSALTEARSKIRIQQVTHAARKPTLTPTPTPITPCLLEP